MLLVLLYELGYVFYNPVMASFTTVRWSIFFILLLLYYSIGISIAHFRNYALHFYAE
jgi:hypothetical protein